MSRPTPAVGRCGFTAVGRCGFTAAGRCGFAAVTGGRRAASPDRMVETRSGAGTLAATVVVRGWTFLGAETLSGCAVVSADPRSGRAFAVVDLVTGEAGRGTTFATPVATALTEPTGSVTPADPVSARAA
ncbi:hypothetical protein [Actinoplanes sp. NPDC051851]|uniref:hypothetical protein n=1 Tax=Actinoplanes sp. NPDC051851 TaxID=3154753 RepID=UPI00344258F3